MAREYKLRLGDGTVVAVDEQGLRTWAIDGKAMVQASGSQHWRPLKEVLAEVAASAPRSGGKLDDGIPIIPLKPLDDGPSARGDTAPRPAAAGLAGAASGWLARLTGRPAPRAKPARAGESPSPALRLRAEEEEEEEEVQDLYEGDYEEGVLSVAWLWMRRLVLIAGFAVAGVVAFNTWPTWLPAVTQVGLVIFTKVDQYVHPEHARKPAAGDQKQQAALGEVTVRLPHLSPETIQLVMSSNSWMEPDPPEVFSRAYTAAKRGAPALAPAEAAELKTLEAALLAGLRPAERQRVREYDRARLQRATLPSEDRDMVGLFARGATALPAPSRARLQALFGKAIAAGLSGGA
jgi:hypothetical protein